MPPVSKELKEKMSVAIDNLRTFLKAMISSDPLFQGFTFISWLIFVHSKQTSKYKSAKQNKNTYNEKKSSGTLIISPLSRNFRHRKLAFQEAKNMAYARRTRLQADNQKHCS